jgi:hypothetical protein
MATPSDLVTHYSSKALQTRLAALGFVGAVLGADVVWKDELIRSDTLGVGLLLIVGSLAELNRRYTYSYICACRAAARSESPTQMWRDFTEMNEAPWSLNVIPRDKRKRKKKSFQNRVSRFLLSWGTYLPGIAAGLYLAWSKFTPREVPAQQILKLAAATLLAATLLIWWGVQSGRSYNPELILGGSEDQKGVHKD